MAVRKTNLSLNDPTNQQIADWEAYASISDVSQAMLLKHCLKAAFVAVGDWEDVSLLAGSVRVDETEREDNTPIQLYGTVDGITSVKSGSESLAYTAVDGLVQPAEFRERVSVTYSTKVNTGDLDRCIVKVWRYATALYDGEAETTLANILLGR